MAFIGDENALLFCAPAILNGKEQRMFERRIQTNIDVQSLIAEAKQLLAEAEQLPLGRRRDLLMERAREAMISANLQGWANSAGLQPPR